MSGGMALNFLDISLFDTPLLADGGGKEHARLLAQIEASTVDLSYSNRLSFIALTGKGFLSGREQL